MGFADVFKTLVGGDPIAGIKSLIDEFHLSPDDKLKFQQATADLEEHRHEIELAQETALAELQSKNITAETSSTDPFVRRARPTFLYVMIGAIAFSLIICPLLNMTLHKGLIPLVIPDAYLQLFGVGFLGYTGARSWEKTKGSD